MILRIPRESHVAVRFDIDAYISRDTEGGESPRNVCCHYFKVLTYVTRQSAL